MCVFSYLILITHIPADDDNLIILDPIPGQEDCQSDYINASYVDVSVCVLSSYSMFHCFYCCGFYSTCMFVHHLPNDLLHSTANGTLVEYTMKPSYKHYIIMPCLCAHVQQDSVFVRVSVLSIVRVPFFHHSMHANN